MKTARWSFPQGLKMIDRLQVIEFFQAVDREFGQACDPGLGQERDPGLDRELGQERDRGLDRDGRIFLVGDTSQLVEGWQRWNTKIDFFSVVDSLKRESLTSVVASVACRMGIQATDEFPGDVVPLPEGYESRSRPLSDSSWSQGLHLKIRHFDPYSVSYRYIMRGGETDYDLILRFLEHSWITESELDSRLEKLLPELTFETIQQDPAELRRRYSGLKQMWKARQVAKSA